ncbi:hypothetical protein Mgra_00001870 [Meloidogyne graminicola]|uniref:Uncharacterized protein n=1 Tax=Meloidogyne graminicola TaxID=189291 RepID=A0A8T0A0F2_9BILA|nr:hypothetical protein Mgra_00001870 [Meloidogyne graminicola]
MMDFFIFLINCSTEEKIIGFNKRGGIFICDGFEHEAEEMIDSLVEVIIERSSLFNLKRGVLTPLLHYTKDTRLFTWTRGIYICVGSDPKELTGFLIKA